MVAHYQAGAVNVPVPYSINFRNLTSQGAKIAAVRVRGCKLTGRVGDNCNFSMNIASSGGTAYPVGDTNFSPQCSDGTR